MKKSSQDNGKFKLDVLWNSCDNNDSFLCYILETDGHKFYFTGIVKNNFLVFWVKYFGSPEDTENFTCTIELGNLSYSRGPVLSFDEDVSDITNDLTTFSTLIGVAKKFKTNGTLPIEVTIHSLKEEVKDTDGDSGVSEPSE